MPRRDGPAATGASGAAARGRPDDPVGGTGRATRVGTSARCSGSAATLGRRWRIGLGVAGVGGRLRRLDPGVGSVATRATRSSRRRRPRSGRWRTCGPTARCRPTSWASVQRIPIGYAISVAIGDRARHRHRHVRLGRGVPRAADRVPPLHPGHRAHCRCSCCGSGIGESPKIWLIVVGTVFFNILMVADVARAVPRELLNAVVHAGRRPAARSCAG